MNLRVPMTGGDYFMLTMDREMRRAGLPGNICRMVVDLDGAVGAEELRRAIAASGLEPWLAGARRATRGFVWTTPHWRVPGANGSALVTERPEGPLLSGAVRQIGSPRRAPGFAFDLEPAGSGRTRLTLTWHHALMDACGAEFLLHRIGGQAGTAGPVFAGGAMPLGRQLRTGLRAYFSDVQFSRRSLDFVEEICRPPIASLVCDGARTLGPGNCYRAIGFTAEETAQVDAQCDRSGAAFRRNLFCLAATVRAVHALVTRRGAPPGAYVIPVPQNRRRRGCPGPVFTNQFSSLYYRVEPEDAAELPRAVATLCRQATEQLKQEVPRSFAVAMELFRNVPEWLYAPILRWPSRGRVASLVFSEAGNSFREPDRFLGVRIADLTHLAPVPVPPGLGVIASRFRGRLRLMLCWVAGCLDDGEPELLERELRAGLLGTDPP